MRDFILLTHKARTSPDFSIENLKDAGRMDTIARTISNTFHVSHHIRTDTNLYVVMNGPPFPPKIITFEGAKLKNLDLDEKSIAELIRQALKKGINLSNNQQTEVLPGIKIAKKSFESLIKEKEKTHELIYLHKKGEDIRKIKINKDPCFIFGDFKGMPKNTEKFLDNHNAKKISLGKVMLLASHCVIIVHNELDRREFI